MKKRLLTMILAGMMACSLTACGGDKSSTDADSAEKATTAVSATSTEAKEEETTKAVDEDNSNVSSVMVYYGWGSSSDEEKYTSEIFCPEGAEFSENTLQEYAEDGSVIMVQIDDEVNEYHASSNMHWHRDAYNNEPTAYPIIAQLYFDGELDAETAEENSGCSQQVTPLGFEWNGYDVMMIETKYTFKDYGEQTEIFVGVEYDLDYWKAEEGTGEIMDLTTKALFGFDMYSTGWDELTQDQCAWIAGELFGVDSGVANPFAGSEEEETEAPVVNVDADELQLDKQTEEADEIEETADIPAELIGTWTDEAGSETYAFYTDGSGYQIYEGVEYTYTYKVTDDRISISYDDGNEDNFSFYVDGDKLVIMNSWVYMRQ